MKSSACHTLFRSPTTGLPNRNSVASYTQASDSGTLSVMQYPRCRHHYQPDSWWYHYQCQEPKTQVTDALTGHDSLWLRHYINCVLTYWLSSVVSQKDKYSVNLRRLRFTQKLVQKLTSFSWQWHQFTEDLRITTYTNATRHIQTICCKLTT